MGSKGLVFAPWTLEFDPKMEILVAPIWVRMLHFPFVLWDETNLKLIRDNLRHFIEHNEMKLGHISFARICVNIDMKKGLLKAIQLNMGGWSHQQALYYEHLVFKCNLCHDYGHFNINYPKARESLNFPQQTHYVKEQGSLW